MSDWIKKLAQPQAMAFDPNKARTKRMLKPRGMRKQKGLLASQRAVSNSVGEGSPPPVSPVSGSWGKVAGQKDAPNYRPASMKEVVSGKRCGTCKARNPKTGLCAAYKFVCNANYICDSWTKR